MDPRTVPRRTGERDARPWIVVLNGVSCSGKSVLAREIVERCPEPVIHLSLDHHHGILAERYATDRWPLYRPLSAGLARAAEAWWRQGFNVVVDTLLETPLRMREVRKVLPPAHTFVIGVNASLDVLLERAESRPEEARRRIRRQFPLVHRQAAYDLELNTDRESPQALAERVLTLVGSTSRSRAAYDALAGLRPIEVGDIQIFTRAAHAGGCHTWLHYVPFLHAVARTERRELLWEEVEGSLVVYHRIDLEQGPRLSLFLPPFPFAAAAVAAAQQRCQRFNPALPTRILWVQDASLPALAGAVASKRVADAEYIYDGAYVVALAGDGFAGLRTRLDQLNRVPGLAVRPYAAGDRGACEALIESWRSLPKTRGANNNVYRFALLCLAHHDSFDRGLLRGEVVTQDGEIRAVTFGGPIGDGVGSLFVVIDDQSLPGLGYLQRYGFMRNNPDIRRFKELGDADAPHLAELKQAFQPVSRNPLWRVVLA